MAQQTHITVPLLLFFWFGFTSLETQDYPTVATVPDGFIHREIGDWFKITCRVTIHLQPWDDGVDALKNSRKTFYVRNCTGENRLHAQVVEEHECNLIGSSEDECTYEWTSRQYNLNSVGVFQYRCFNDYDRNHHPCLGPLLQVNVSRPATPSTRIPPSTTIVSSTLSSTVPTTTVIPTALDTTYAPTSDGGSKFSSTAGNLYLTSTSISSTQPIVKDIVDTVTGSTSTSNGQNDQQVSGRKGSQWTLIVSPVLGTIVVIMAALLAMFWKCRRRRSSELPI